MFIIIINMIIKLIIIIMAMIINRQQYVRVMPPGTSLQISLKSIATRILTSLHEALSNL